MREPPYKRFHPARYGCPHCLWNWCSTQGSIRCPSRSSAPATQRQAVLSKRPRPPGPPGGTIWQIPGTGTNRGTPAGQGRNWVWCGFGPSQPPTPRTGSAASSPCWSGTPPQTGPPHPGHALPQGGRRRSGGKVKRFTGPRDTGHTAATPFPGGNVPLTVTRRSGMMTPNKLARRC